MRKSQRAMSRQRFVMYISAHLRQEIEERVRQSGLTLAAFGRKAFEAYLSQARKDETRKQLAQTCLIFQQKNQQIFEEWAQVDQSNWPS